MELYQFLRLLTISLNLAGSRATFQLPSAPAGDHWDLIMNHEDRHDHKSSLT